MGEKKFPSVMKVVKTALVLGHGNAFFLFKPQSMEFVQQLMD